MTRSSLSLLELYTKGWRVASRLIPGSRARTRMPHADAGRWARWVVRGHSWVTRVASLSLQQQMQQSLLLYFVNVSSMSSSFGTGQDMHFCLLHFLCMCLTYVYVRTLLSTRKLTQIHMNKRRSMTAAPTSHKVKMMWQQDGDLCINRNLVFFFSS